jgi:hypothetical protein
MAVLQRPDLLALVALGTNGGQPLLDGSSMATGVHLQWQPKGGLGFPTGGFDVHRRTTPQGQLVCATFGPPFSPSGNTFTWMGFGFVASAGTVAVAPGGCAGTGALALPGTRTLDATPPWPARMLQITVEGSGPQLVASAWWEVDGEAVPVARGMTSLVGGNRVVTLFADRMDRIRIEGTNLAICKVCGVEALNGVNTGWGAPLNATPIVLPVTDASWPTTHPNSPNDQLEAEARLPGALSTPQRTKYAQAFQVALHAMLVDMVRTVPQSSWEVGGEGTSLPGDSRPAPAMRLPGVATLALHALDPNVARMLGLYFVDATAVPSTLYDYKVVGHYGNERWPGERITFDDLEPGRLYIRPLNRDAATLYSGRPMIVVTEMWAGVAHTAIRMDVHPVLLLPLWAVLPAPAPAVSIQIKSSLGASAKTWSGATLVSTVSIPAGEQVVHLEPGSSFDRISLDNTSGFFLFELVVREQAGFVGDVTAVTFRHQPTAPPGVRALELSAFPLPLPTGFRPDGSFNENPNAAGLAWSEPPTVFPLRNPGLPILVDVVRDARGTGATPGTVTASVTLNAGSPALVSAAPSLGLQPDGWPAVQLHYVDRGAPDGWYDYRVRGVAMFGRLGPFSAPMTLNLRDPVAPPAPAGFRASYVDDDQPHLATGELADRAAGSSLFDLSWIWTGMARLQAPDVEAGGEFRVYRQDGERDRLAGTVTGVAVSGSTSTITTDQTWTGAVDALIDERIRVAGTWFKVLGNTSGPAFTLELENLESPTATPTTGAFLLPFRSAGPNATDWRIPTAWTLRIHAVAARADGRVTGTITSVSTHPDDPELRIVTTGATLADPDGVLVPGALVCQGQVWEVAVHTTGALQLTIASRTSPDGTVLAPTAGATFTYVAGIRHHIQVPATLEVADADATATTWLGVSASDGKSHASDDPAWSAAGRGGLGGRPGNEGPVGISARVFATHHGTPDAPTPPTASEPVYAEPADYYGIAHYDLTWDPVPDPGRRYVVHRATGAALFLRDMEQRRALTGEYEGETSALTLDFDLGASTWFAASFPDLDEGDLLSSSSSEVLQAWRAFAEWFYPQLTDAQLRDLADREGNEAAFAVVTPRAVSEVTLADSFDGRGAGVVLYKIQAVDASGNTSPLSRALPVVHVVDVTPPGAPAVLGVYAGQNSVRLEWRSSSAPDIAEYRIWRRAPAEAEPDRRRDTPHALVAASDEAIVLWTDEDLAGGEEWLYWVAAVDTAGNVSEPATAVRGRAVDSTLPEPGTWTRVAWVRLGPDGTEYAYDDPAASTLPAVVALEWTTAEAETTCVVQRREAGRRVWADATPALDPISGSDDLFQTYDETATPDTIWEYRVRVTDRSGNLNIFRQLVERLSAPA